jgi:hypothetical protein
MSAESLAVVSSGIVLLVALGLLFMLSRAFGKVDGATFIAILLVPLLVYGILSGRLAEFSGPGGWGAKFQAVAEMEIDPTAIVEGAEQLDLVEKGGFDTLRDFAGRLDRKRPNAVSLEVGRSGYYSAEAIQTYIRTLQSAGSATYVIFIDHETKRFIGSANSDQVLALIGSSATRDAFMQELQNPGEGEEPFAEFRFLVRESLTPNDTNSAALDKFLASGAQALVVLDDSGQPSGVVDRDRLMTRLMKTLATGAS